MTKPVWSILLLSLPSSQVAPEQSFEEAMSEVRDNAESLLGVKSLLESESWGEAQRALRKSSALLKKDIYTIIQNKPGNERPRLRKLYSDLFNGVTRLDYAARDRDKDRVRECYGRITEALSDILSSLWRFWLQLKGNQVDVELYKLRVTPRSLLSNQPDSEGTCLCVSYKWARFGSTEDFNFDLEPEESKDMFLLIQSRKVCRDSDIFNLNISKPINTIS